MNSLQTLYSIIEYEFKDEQLIIEALTHSSCDAGYSYERLEFLGDAVLELIVSNFLYRTFTDYPEGKLTNIRSKLVREDYLSKWAIDKGINKYILLGKGEENANGRFKKSILCDIVESIIGAMYLDSSYEIAEQFVMSIIDFDNIDALIADAKNDLQEYLQKQHINDFRYVLEKEEGPDHNKKFYVSFYIEDRKYGEGFGNSKKEAEKISAINTLKILKGE